MSDFGTMVTIHRTNGKDTTPDDEARIKKATKDLVYGEPDRVSDFADFNLKFGGSSNAVGSEGIMVGLTEYRMGDDQGNEGLEDEVLIARDTPVAEQFAEKLKEAIGDEFEVKCYCGHW